MCAKTVGMILARGKLSKIYARNCGRVIAGGVAGMGIAGGVEDIDKGLMWL